MDHTLSNGQTVKIRELNAGDIFDAQDGAKELQPLPNGAAMFVVDHVKLERLLLLSSIQSVDGDTEKANIKWLRELSVKDYYDLQMLSEKVDSAVLAEVGERGRDSAAS